MSDNKARDEKNQYRLRGADARGSMGGGVTEPAKSQIEMFRETLPEKPRACDFFSGGPRVCPKEIAARKLHIQPNAPWEINWLVFDIDRDSAQYDWHDLHVQPPNLTAMNRKNGHAHLFYHVDPGVLSYKYNHNNRPEPFRYLAAIDVAMTRELDADPAYNKSLSKNPLVDYWLVREWITVSYTLGELAKPFDLAGVGWLDLRRRLPEIGLGRNCDLFDRTRRWAYRSIRKGGYRDAEDFTEACVSKAGEYNLDFALPLGESETKAVGKSVGSWTWEHITPEGFRAWCARRGRKSGIVRAAKRDEMTAEARFWTGAGADLTGADLAAALGVSERTGRQRKADALGKSGHERSLERAAQVKALHAAGKTQAQIALMLGITKARVCQILKS